MRRSPVMWLMPLVVLALTTVALATHSNQIIVITNRNWNAVEVAEFLYNKHPGDSTVLLWNKTKKQFYKLKGKELDLDYLDFRKTRIQIVGHGGMTKVDGKQVPTLGGLSPDDLAIALNTLYPVEKRVKVKGKHVNNISRISLVGCYCAGEGSSTPPEDTFCGMLILKLKEAKYNIDTSISGRTTLVGVDSTGKKLTGTLNNRFEILWEYKSPAAKIIYTLDEKKGKKIITHGEYVTRKDAIPCYVCGVKSYGPENSSENGVIIGIREDGVQTVRLSLRTLYGIIDGATRNIFDNAAKDTDGKPSRTAEVKEYIVRERTGDPIVRKVRQINSLQDLVNEINYFGMGNSSEFEEHEYYRFSDFIIRMNTSNFYVETTGVILNKLPKGFNGDQIPQIGEEYWDMTGVDIDFFSDMRKFMGGKGEEITVNFDDEASKMAKATNGQRILAMTLSESIRNFRCHVVNMIGLDLNAHDFLSHQQFFDAHPMARGGTWPVNVNNIFSQKPTGFEGSYGNYSWEHLYTYVKKKIADEKEKLAKIDKKRAKKINPANIIENAKLVRERLSNFLGSWLSLIGHETLSIDTKSGVKQFMEQYQGADSPTHIIADVNSTNSFYQAIINATQDILVKNFGETTEKSTVIIDNPNPIRFAGPLGEQIETPEVEVAGLRDDMCYSIYNDLQNIMLKSFRVVAILEPC